MNALVIANTQIRRDVIGRYCLNDLHQASGGNKKHQPHDWLRLEKTCELVAEVEANPVSTPGNPGVESAVQVINGGPTRGTYAVKELVYAYAMWISAPFHLHVIRAYDAMVTQPDALPAVPTSPQHRADVLVSASRGFNALVRAGRSIGMDRIRSVRAANTATLRATGIDLIAELDASDVLGSPALHNSRPSIVDRTQTLLAPWLQGRASTRMEDVIKEALHGDPESRDLQTRVGIAMRRLGWWPKRTGAPGQRSRTWYPPATPP
ncbi:KilA-N domain-containing protein [Rhodanobacter sp. BL-MT-08]